MHDVYRAMKKIYDKITGLSQEQQTRLAAHLQEPANLEKERTRLEISALKGKNRGGIARGGYIEPKIVEQYLGDGYAKLMRDFKLKVYYMGRYQNEHLFQVAYANPNIDTFHFSIDGAGVHIANKMPDVCSKTQVYSPAHDFYRQFVTELEGINREHVEVFLPHEAPENLQFLFSFSNAKLEKTTIDRLSNFFSYSGTAGKAFENALKKVKLHLD